MTMGILIHNLVQNALTQNILEITPLRKEADKIIKESIQMLYDAGLSEDEARVNMHSYIAPLADFMQYYVVKPPVTKVRFFSVNFLDSSSVFTLKMNFFFGSNQYWFV